MAAQGAGGDEEYGTRGGVLPLQPQTKRGEPAKLGVSPDGTKVIYCNQNTVVVRDIEDPSKAFIYGEHTANVKGACRLQWPALHVGWHLAHASLKEPHELFHPPFPPTQWQSSLQMETGSHLEVRLAGFCTPR